MFSLFFCNNFSYLSENQRIPWKKCWLGDKPLPFGSRPISGRIADSSTIFLRKNNIRYLKVSSKRKAEFKTYNGHHACLAMDFSSSLSWLLYMAFFHGCFTRNPWLEQKSIVHGFLPAFWGQKSLPTLPTPFHQRFRPATLPAWAFAPVVPPERSERPGAERAEFQSNGRNPQV